MTMHATLLPLVLFCSVAVAAEAPDLLGSNDCRHFRINKGLEELSITNDTLMRACDQGGISGCLQLVEAFVRTASIYRYRIDMAPELPLVPDDVLAAMKYLSDMGEKSHLSAIASVFVRYRIMEIDERLRPSQLIAARHPYCRALISGLHDDEFVADEWPMTRVAAWIGVHRDRFAPSKQLDSLLELLREKEKSEIAEMKMELSEYFRQHPEKTAGE